MQPRSTLHLFALVLALVAALSPAATAQQGEGEADGGGSAGGTPPVEVVRLAGDDRIGTAVAVAEAHEPSDVVAIGRADAFPDALAGAHLGIPLLLTGRDRLPAATRSALDGVARAIVLGGEAAVSEAVAGEIESAGVAVTRLAGADRIETAAAVATREGTVVGTVGDRPTALLASAATFADALVAGPLAAGASLPLLLTHPDALPEATRDALADLAVEQVLIVGGSAAVSADVLAAVQAAGMDVRRLSGPTRQETAVAVAELAAAELGWPLQAVALATGADFPDALAIGPLAGSRRAPLLLTGGAVAAAAVGGLLGCGLSQLLVAGGPAAVGDAEVEAVSAAAGTGDGCAFAPQLLPAQAVVPVGDTHEVVLDARSASAPAFGQATGGSADASGGTVRWSVVADTLSRAVATPTADDLPPGPGGGGGLEGSTALDDQGRASLRFTSSTPGLVVVQACVAGPDGEEVCEQVAVQFSARYAADVGEAGRGFVSLHEGRLCASLVGVDEASILVTDADGGEVAAIGDGTGCVEGTGLDRAAVDAAPEGLGFTTGAGFFPLAVIGSDYAAWEPAEPEPFVPGPLTQGNTELIATIGELNDVTAINFIDYGDRDVLFATGRFGLKSFDVSDPTAPTLLDWEAMPDFWENEDMSVDEDRRLVFMARDPRAYGGSTDDGVAGLYIIDASDPADLRRIVFHELPAGHTASCVRSERDDGTVAPCDFLWSGGPATGTHQPQDWGGRPVFVTDVRDPERPFTHPMPLLEGQNDGTTDYAHDVQVDADGLAWVSSRGGVYGFHTSGTHVDPLTGEERVATPADPVPFAGGTLEGEDTSGGVIHNSYRPVGAEAHLGADLAASGFAEGELVYATDEAFTSACTTDGLFNIVTLEGSYGGEGFVSTPEAPFRLRTVGTWSPVTAGEPGPVALCSAHYFDMRDSIVAYSWYGQGTRFIDVSDPTDPIQVAFHRPLVGSSFAPRFRGDVVFVADSMRGIDIVRLTDGAFEAQAAHTQIAAPALPGLSPEVVAASVAGGPIELGGRTWEADPVYGWSCWVPRPEAG
jgi:putative cell wall-binding protein